MLLNVRVSSRSPSYKRQRILVGDGTPSGIDNDDEVVMALVVTMAVSPLDCCDSALQALLGGLPVNGA